MKAKIKFISRAFIIFIYLILCGCAIPKNIVESISGNYMGGLNSDKASSISQVCVYPIDECFEKALSILMGSELNASILKKNTKNYAILALVSRQSLLEETESTFEANSADVGIFLAKVGPGTTKVEVRSWSSVMADYTAKKLFAGLQIKN
ncbi:MAG: hypothetical protein ABIA97_01385 [Candidatus Omnitrophota bacterium]